jgi:sugar phosphate isomerase/epimerase
MNTRRNFLKEIGLLSAALALSPQLLSAAGKSNKKVGIQLYTLRDIIGKDVSGVIQQVAKAGFKEVEPYGFDPKTGFWKYSAPEFKKLLDDNGLVAPSGHYGFEDFITSGNLDQLKPHVEAAATLKSKYVVLPWLSEQNRKNTDSFKLVADRLNQAGEYCKQNGMLAAYHNHGFEFDRLGNSTGLDILLAETDKNLVHFELDLYWAEFAKQDPIALFQKHPKRFKMWHVKDMDKQNRNWNTEIGKGNIDFKTIFAAAKTSGVKHIYLEQETNYKPDIIASINTSITYIKDQLL